MTNMATPPPGYGNTPDGSRPRRKVRAPLTANQHILHLLLTVFTFGLWIPVWFIRAAMGNVTWEEVPGRPAPAGAAPDLPYAPPRWPDEPIPGSWADRQQRGQERQPRR